MFIDNQEGDVKAEQNVEQAVSQKPEIASKSNETNSYHKPGTAVEEGIGLSVFSDVDQHEDDNVCTDDANWVYKADSTQIRMEKGH